MRTEQVNLRLEADLLASLEQAAREEALDRATMIRRLLVQGLERWRRKRTLDDLDRGDISIGRAAEETGRTHYDLIERARAKGRAYPLAPEDVDDWPPFGSQPRVADRPKGPHKGDVAMTLPDRAPRVGGVLLVGINPARVSVDAGHYYQGRLGQRLWKRLEALGLLANAVPGAEDDAFVSAGNGLTDVVKRATASAAELSSAELEAGVGPLREKIRSWKPGLVLFAFVTAARVATGDATLKPGPGPVLEAVPTFLFTGPYASAEETEANNRKLRHLLRRR